MIRVDRRVYSLNGTKNKRGGASHDTHRTISLDFFQGCGRDVAGALGDEGKEGKEQGEGQGQRHG